MDVNIIEIESSLVLSAKIISHKNLKAVLPSFTDGWRFNFKKYSKYKNYKTYALYCSEAPDRIEACLIFEMRNKIEPYMAYVEVAPHNRGLKKQHANVAECLIAFACRLSFIYGERDYLGWLTFDVLEEFKEDEVKLMAVYSSKYHALKFGETTMVIPPEGGQKLIDEFLNV